MPEAATNPGIQRAACLLPGGDLSETLHFFTETLSFRLDSIMPADDPRIAHISGHGLHLQLDASYHGEAGVLRLGTTHEGFRDAIAAPNGTRIEFEPATPPLRMPELKSGFSVQRCDDGPDAWKSGRAGMHYRDLIPDRQGGQFIASHIRIPHGGPVGDHVHHHAIRLQLIYCHRGWARLVYEDQGDPFVMHAGDCVLQPPHIRHRVLESSDGLEVIEIGSPAEHMTWLDHEMTLPTGRHLPTRGFGGQRFVFHQAQTATWSDEDGTGMALRDLGIASATGGLAAAHVMRRRSAGGAQARTTIQDKTFAFAFVLEGSMTLQVGDSPPAPLKAGDAFVVPAGMRQMFADCSVDWSLLQVFAQAS